MSQTNQPTDEGLDLSFLSMGQPIEVEIQKPSLEQSEVYFSQIMDLEASHLLIAVPQRQGRIAARLFPGDTLFLRVMMPDASYACACRMLGWQEQPQGMRVSRPLSIERVQRRNFVRIDAELPVTLTAPAESEPPVLIEANTTDISGGGMMVFADAALPMDAVIEGKLFLPPENIDPSFGFEMVSFKAQVCRCQPHNQGFLIGLSFTDELSENMRDKIIRYIFRYQRESIRNKPHLSL